jgi:hypothetical protein
MFTFRGVAEDSEQLARRIRRVLERRNAMHIGELHMRLGMDMDAVRAELDAMVSRGEVERMRPIGYTRDDHDFFAVNGPSGMEVRTDNMCVPQVTMDGEQEVRLAGETMACLVD